MVFVAIGERFNSLWLSALLWQIEYDKMKYKLRIEQEASFASSIDEIENKGSKFFVFPYCISIFALTLRRLSPAILVKNDESSTSFRRKYNTLSLLFGWWGIPWGPIYTFRYLSTNRKGGIDVTEDILLNLTKDGFDRSEVEILQTNQLFCKPDKLDTKAFRRALLDKLEMDYKIKLLVVGLFINTNDGEDPYFTVGYSADENFDCYIESIKTALFTQFRKYTHFEFVDLTKDDKKSNLLIKQGEIIINRNS